LRFIGNHSHPLILSIFIDVHRPVLISKPTTYFATFQKIPENASNPAASFRLPFPGESGTRNNFRGQGFFGIDMGVNKTFRFTERHSLRFSAYAYNLTNSVRFDPATLTFNNSLTNAASLGAYSGTLTKPRVMEFALRYQF
jgi:hypothetical protein